MSESLYIQTISERINQRRHQYLFHSYLYYELDFATISDDMFTYLSNDLIRLQNEYPELCVDLPFHDICSKLDNAYTNPKVYNPKFEYPDTIVTRASHAYSQELKMCVREMVESRGMIIVDDYDSDVIKANNQLIESTITQKREDLLKVFNDNPSLLELFKS